MMSRNSYRLGSYFACSVCVCVLAQCIWFHSSQSLIHTAALLSMLHRSAAARIDFITATTLAGTLYTERRRRRRLGNKPNNFHKASSSDRNSFSPGEIARRILVARLLSPDEYPTVGGGKGSFHPPSLSPRWAKLLAFTLSSPSPPHQKPSHV